MHMRFHQEPGNGEGWPRMEGIPAVRPALPISSCHPTSVMHKGRWGGVVHPRLLGAAICRVTCAAPVHVGLPAAVTGVSGGSNCGMAGS